MDSHLCFDITSKIEKQMKFNDAWYILITYITHEMGYIRACVQSLVSKSLRYEIRTQGQIILRSNFIPSPWFSLVNCTKDKLFS